MKIMRPFVLLVLATSTSGLLLAQQPTSPSSPPKQEVKSTSSSSGASPELDVLKKWVGTWDAPIESTGRDGKPVTNVAKATAKLSGGRGLVTDFGGTFL